MGLFSYLFGSDNSRNLKKVNKIVDLIEEKSDFYKKLTDEELQGKTKEYQELLAKEEDYKKQNQINNYHNTLKMLHYKLFFFISCKKR